MDETIIDACCLINLSATGELNRFLRQLGGKWHVPRVVQAEALYLRAEQPDGTVEREAISLQPAISAGVLIPCDITEPTESDLYVQLASSLDDGEAMALALAKSRGWRLATDDRKAISMATQLDVEVVTTPELVNVWAVSTQASVEEQRRLIRLIQSRARFFPNRHSPHRGWWHDLAE